MKSFASSDYFYRFLLKLDSRVPPIIQEKNYLTNDYATLALKRLSIFVSEQGVLLYKSVFDKQPQDNFSLLAKNNK